MKKWKIYSIIISIILVLIIIGICLYTFIFKQNITEEEAKNIAFEYTDVKKSDVTILSVTKDREDREYEIRFYDNTYEYEIDINYNNGNINNLEKDLRNDANIDLNQTVSISEEEAKNIVLQKISKSSDEVTFTKIKVDRENGITIYDIQLYDNEKEYEIGIDVETKEIISYKENLIKTNNINNDSSTSNNYLNSDEAKDIVLKDANLTRNEVKFTKVELDVDYQIATYEIEFSHDFYEYEYELNAITGDILKYERGK